MTRGTIPGATASDRAARLAGILAELGVGRMTLTRPGSPPQELLARRTDLPSVIISAATGSAISVASPAIRIALGPQRLEWESDDSSAIQSLSPT